MALTDSCSCRSTVLVGLWYVVLHRNAHKKPCIGSTSWNCYTPFALSNRLWRQSKTSWADMPRYIASWGGNTWNDLEIKLGSNNIYRGFWAFSKCIRDIGIQYCISSKKILQLHIWDLFQTQKSPIINLWEGTALVVKRVDQPPCCENCLLKRFRQENLALGIAPWLQTSGTKRLGQWWLGWHLFAPDIFSVPATL